jgi:nitrite reductase/ring-hydroxylating ferredoxin subunit
VRRLVETEHRLGPLEDIPIGEGRAYAVADLQIAVFRLRSGTLRATQAVCPHAGGPLADGQLDDSVVLCPLHAAAFDLETGQARTAHPPLTVYPVRVVDGCMTVTAPEVDVAGTPTQCAAARLQPTDRTARS